MGRSNVANREKAASLLETAVVGKILANHHLTMHGHKYKPLQWLAGKVFRGGVRHGAKRGKKGPLWNRLTRNMVGHFVDPHLAQGYDAGRRLGASVGKRQDVDKLLKRLRKIPKASKSAKSMGKAIPVDKKYRKTVNKALKEGDKRVQHSKEFFESASRGLWEDTWERGLKPLRQPKGGIRVLPGGRIVHPKGAIPPPTPQVSVRPSMPRHDLKKVGAQIRMKMTTIKLAQRMGVG